MNTAAIARPAPIGHKRRRIRLGAFSLGLPLLAFLLVFFVAPILYLFQSAAYDPAIKDSLPRTLMTLQDWQGGSLPGESTFDGLATDLRELDRARNVIALAQRVGMEATGGRQLIMKTTRAVARAKGPVTSQTFASIDPLWADPGFWQVLKSGGNGVTPLYLTIGMGLHTPYGSAESGDDNNYGFPTIFLRTVVISIVVTLITIVLAYPTAYAIVQNDNRLGKWLLAAVLIPFWVSLLVRSMSWVVLLQGNGLAAELLRALGLIGPDAQLLYTRGATLVAMAQIQLPFTLLPMLGVMRGISPSHMRAARSLGAKPTYAHLKVYLPQAAPGIVAGGMITFILSLGYYITPALVGGPADQMISYYVARFTNEELNWNLAASLSVLLLLLTILCLVAMRRFLRLDRLLK
ncbi:putative spermidine/putrescine transport system permease protein [Arboricoccus pini]|uniref:Putative spermidine/putrescine transport system permease protein n=1 Tax=Arboricoccus pini TaxID=1963835 RepID=A0A212RJM4_9PROT|nr:ABC transporter permease [Arboricoccus pini]SNB72628.1 putative spermidine/putrescine transport system permease protein [Arboricoccus pini]